MRNTTIAVQLYTVREQLNTDFKGTIRAIAEMGYTTVEAAPLPAGITVQTAHDILSRYNLQVCAVHSPLPLRDTRDAVLNTANVLGCQYVVCPWLDPDLYFQSVDGIKQACALLNAANEVARGAGLTLGYHNHWFEIALVEGKPAYHYMLDFLDEHIVFELDVYWVKVGGLDPVHVIQELGGRLPLIHIKDGPAETRAQAMTAVGRGTLDIPAIIAASPLAWHIVELDRCDTDMLAAVRDSYTYLAGVSH